MLHGTRRLYLDQRDNHEDIANCCSFPLDYWYGSVGRGFQAEFTSLEGCQSAGCGCLGPSWRAGEDGGMLLQAQTTHDHARAVLPSCCARFTGVERCYTCHGVFLCRPSSSCLYPMRMIGGCTLEHARGCCLPARLLDMYTRYTRTSTTAVQTAV